MPFYFKIVRKSKFKVALLNLCCISNKINKLLVVTTKLNFNIYNWVTYN